MWRSSFHISKTVQRSQLVKLPCTSRMCTQVPKLEAAKQQESAQQDNIPPESPKKKSRWFLKLLGLSVVGLGGAVGYSWYDSDFRKLIETNIPYSKDALEYIFQYIPQSFSSTHPIEVEKQISKLPERKSAIPVIKEVAITEKQEAEKVEKVVDAKEAKALKKEREKTEAAEKRRKEKEKAELALRQREEQEANENRELEFILDRLSSESKKSVESAIVAQKSAAEAIRQHTAKLKEAMETSATEGQWEAVTDTHQSRSDAMWASTVTSERANTHMEKLRSAINDGKKNKNTKKNKVLLSSEEELNSLNRSLSAANAESLSDSGSSISRSTLMLSKAQSEAKVFAEYRDLVKKGKDQFKKELESILPDAKISASGGHLSEDELNSLIAHAHRRIEQLQKQLAEQQAMEQQRIQLALERQKEEDSKIADEMVSKEQDHMKAELSVLKEKWDLDARVQFEKELRAQLSRQAAAHSDHLGEVLKVQERELEAKFDVRLSEHIQKEKENFEHQVAGWVARLHGIEVAIDNRAELEKQGRQAQELWLACQTLQTMIDLGRPGAVTLDDQLKPLAPEITAIREAGESNPLVSTVLSSIPEPAIHRGVWTELALAERFARVNKICRLVAMIDETGGTLFKYFLSYLQSFFVFRTGRLLTDSDEIDPSELSTFTLLDNAQQCIEQGDLHQAVRYINQLRGEPRRVASDWLLEARLLLETKQAASALLATASASGLGSIS